jgi:hypothetical protein
MKTIFFFLISMGVAVSSLLAQETSNLVKKTTFFAGAQASIAAGDLSPTHKWGVGVQGQVVHPLPGKNSLTGQVKYTYLFGKKSTYSFSEPGGPNYHHTTKHKGMNDVNLLVGIRHNVNANWFGGIGAGLCLGFAEGESATSLDGEAEIGYLFLCSESPLLHAIAAYFNICGDPKLQVGIRYSVGF